MNPDPSESRFCPICGPASEKKPKYASSGGSGKFAAESFNSRDTFRNNRFPFVECANCGIIFADPAPSAETVSRLYEVSTQEYDSLEPWTYQTYRALLRRAEKFISDRGTFLEIGGGTGFLLRYAAESGFGAQIEIEPSKNAEDKFAPPSSSARFIRDIFRGNEVPGNSVGEIVFFHTLDHIPDPLAFLKNAFGVLRPGGIAVCAVHNTRSLSARMLKQRSPIFNISHTYLFNKENASAILKKAGFEVLEIIPYANTYPLWYWLRDVNIAPRLKSKLLALLGRLRLANIPIKFFAGNMAIIARKPAA